MIGDNKRQFYIAQQINELDVSSTGNNMRRIQNFIIPLTILAAWIGWATFVVQYGSTHNETFVSNGDGQPFGASGAFGDSFGSIASLMAALAAAGAFLTFFSQNQTSKRQIFETNFFTLLSHFEQIAQSTDVDIFKVTRAANETSTSRLRQFDRKIVGKDAFKQILKELRKTLQPSDFRDIKIVSKKYDRFFNIWVDDLGHYFRLLYHLIKMTHEFCPEESIYYMRIIRAHLSQSELVLLAYNSILGEGQEIFVEYLIEYSFFHNLHQEPQIDLTKQELDFFRRKIPEPAFRFTKPTALDYSDRVRRKLPSKIK